MCFPPSPASGSPSTPSAPLLEPTVPHWLWPQVLLELDDGCGCHPATEGGEGRSGCWRQPAGATAPCIPTMGGGRSPQLGPSSAKCLPHHDSCPAHPRGSARSSPHGPHGETEARGGESTAQGLTVHGRWGHTGPGPMAGRVGVHCPPAGLFGVQLAHSEHEQASIWVPGLQATAGSRLLRWGCCILRG